MTDSPRPFSLAKIRDLLTGIRRRLPWPGQGAIRRPEPDVREPEVKEPALPDPDEVARERLRVQVEVIRKAFGTDGVAVAGREGTRAEQDGAAVEFLYRPGHLLVRDGGDFERLQGFLQEREDYRGELERVAEPAKGLVLVSLPTRVDGGDEVLATLDELDRRDDFGPGFATPDHVLYVTAHGRLCPATEPELPPCRDPLPAQTDDKAAGDGVRVAVVDTGLWEPAVTSSTTPWLSGVVADPTDVETVNPASIHPYAGHGTFVAGIVRCLAPATRIEVEGALPNGGAVYESEICRQLAEALEDDDHPQLISISAGTHTRNDFALLSFEMLAAAHGLDDGEETLVIAAAGNDGSDQPFWPAAFPWVVGVGSVDPDGAVSDFSNVGKWVDVYARGRDLVNAFPDGTYTCYEPPNIGEVRTFEGLAQWSGTSFSTPVVTGLVAARMSATGESARTAYQSVVGAGTAGSDPRGGSITTVGPL
jgi:hypothetical protein